MNTKKRNQLKTKFIPMENKKQKKLSVLFTYPNPLDISGGAAVVWCVSVLADVSNERSFPSSAPSIKRLLPLQSFTRGLISMKSKLPLVPALRLQTPSCLLGVARISALFLFLPSFSSSLFSPLRSPFQVFPGVCEFFVFALFLLSSQDRWEQTAWQFSSPFYPLSCLLCVAALSLSLSPRLSVSPNWAERDPWSTILKEGSRLWCILHANTQPSWIWPTVCTLIS